MDLIDLTGKLTQAGLKDLVLDSGARGIKQVFEDQIAIRRAALSGKEKGLGFPTICLPFEMAKDLEMETLMGAVTGGQIRRIGGLFRFRGRFHFSPAFGTVEYLYRSAAAHDCDPGYL